MAEQSKEEAAPEGRGKRSRREILAGAAGAPGVIAAQTVGRATPAQAGVDGDVVLGVDNQSTGGITGVTTTGTTGLHGKSTNSDGIGVAGDANSFGVWGYGATGVYGSGNTGVHGDGGTGVLGQGSTGDGVHGLGSTGVYGYGEISNGVFGETAVAAASGVYGEARPPRQRSHQLSKGLDPAPPQQRRTYVLGRSPVALGCQPPAGSCPLRPETLRPLPRKQRHRRCRSRSSLARPHGPGVPRRGDRMAT